MKRIREALKEIEAKSTSPNSNPIKEASNEGKKTLKEESGDSAAIVNSTSSPQSKSSNQPVPDTGSLAAEEFVLLDCQASKPTEGLDSLIRTLRHQIHSSDWLEKNTPELSAEEDPQILDVFKALLQRARK